jgi:hypothetical protein
MVVAAAVGVGCGAAVDPMDMEKGSEAKNSRIRNALNRDIVMVVVLVLVLLLLLLLLDCSQVKFFNSRYTNQDYLHFNLPDQFSS